MVSLYRQLKVNISVEIFAQVPYREEEASAGTEGLDSFFSNSPTGEAMLQWKRV